MIPSNRLEDPDSISDATPPVPAFGPRLAVTASERRRTRVERVRFAYSETRLAMLLVAPVVAVVWLFLRDEVEQHRLANWSVALALTYAARLLVAELHSHRPAGAAPAVERRWTSMFYVAVAASGFAWSLLVWYVLEDASPALRLSGVTVLIAVSAAALRGLATLPFAYALFAGASMQPANNA